MKTRAVRLYGVNDLRLEEFDLPHIKDTEILASVVSDSICMSSYKAVVQGAAHKKVPDDVAQNPVIIGHELCGTILEVGEKWKSKFVPGEKFTIQPALNYKGSLDAPGYSYPHLGGGATKVIIPNEVMETGNLLKYDGRAYFHGSLAEPMSCIIGAFHANYHTEPGKYHHNMGVLEGGNMSILAGAGPMGLGAIDYALNSERKPGLLVVTDIDEKRLERAKKIFPESLAAEKGVKLYFLNTKEIDNPWEYLLDLTHGKGYDDVFVFAPIRELVEGGDLILARDGCLNFFAGPVDNKFSANFNFYDAHYISTHIVGTSGGNKDDMREALEMMALGKINPASMITHVGGLDSVPETTLKLPEIPGGKKLIYTKVNMDLVAIDDFESLGKKDPRFRDLYHIVKDNNGLWCQKAEEYLLANF